MSTNMRRYGFGWARPRAETRKVKKPFPVKLFQRVDVTIQPNPDEGNDDLINARVLLNDLSASGVSLFLTKSVSKGTPISLVINGPKYIFLKGYVIWCVLHNRETRIITQTRYEFRARIVFDFESEAEMKQLQLYCDGLREDGLLNLQFATAALKVDKNKDKKTFSEIAQSANLAPSAPVPLAPLPPLQVKPPELTEEQEIDMLFERLKRMTDAVSRK